MKTFLNFIGQKQKLLREKNHVFSPVSGGQDSLLLIFILLHTKKFSALDIIYCQHFWQPKNFLAARFLFQLSFLIEAPYTVVLPKKVLCEENFSRSWRKKIFFRFGGLEKIPSLFTGHTLTDNFETSVNNLLRGTSPKIFYNFKTLNFKKSTKIFFSTTILKPTILSNQLQSTINVKKEFLQLNKTYPKIYFRGGDYQNKKCLRDQPNYIYVITKNKVFEQNIAPIIRKDIIYRKPLKFKQKFNFAKPKNSTKVPIIRSKITMDSKNYLKRSILIDKVSNSFLILSKASKIQLNSSKILKNLSRVTVSKILDFYKLPLITDMTNLSFKFSRNKVRHSLLPFLRFSFHKKIEVIVNPFFEKIGQEIHEVENQAKNLTLFLKLRTPRKLNEKFNQDNLTTLQFRLLHLFFFEYKEIELNSIQVSNLKNFIYSKKIEKRGPI